MARDDGTATAALEIQLDKLRNNPHEFDFFQAVRLLECVYREHPRYGESVRLSDEPVRLKQEPSLKFAPSTVAGFQSARGTAHHEMSVHFFGLCGPNGALPLHLTEYIRDRIRHHDDPTMAAFLDVFHHRMLSLFFRVWADAQPTVQFDRPETDRFADYIGSLIGIGMPSLKDRDRLPDRAKLYYAGQLACQTRNPDGIRAMLADFFGVPVEIEEFVGQWTRLPEQCQFMLGADPDSSTLGVACTLGSHVWDCQQKFRVTIGPLCWDDFARLLPGGDSLQRLVAMVRNYIGDELLWDLNLVLHREETPSWTLGEGKLGQTIWIDSEGVKEDSRDLVLHS